MNDTLDFEQRLSRAMHDLVPDDLDSPPAVADLRTERARRRPWLAVASIGAVAAAGAAIAFAVLPTHDSGPGPADHRSTSAASVPECPPLQLSTGKLQVDGSRASTAVRLENTGASCRFETAPSISIARTGVAHLAVPFRRSKDDFPVTVPAGSSLRLRIDYVALPTSATGRDWTITLRTGGATGKFRIRFPAKPGVMPDGWTVVGVSS